ncbi:MAG: 7-cyano-7-deazaguanine synthase, partial [Chloroflexota bacterium]|nr:7-cyano-7-deazaguanine synthase [Chloroflexota bacterium]
MVTHRSANKVMKFQDELVADLKHLFPRRITWLPVRATLVGRASVEQTQRSRSFFFAALGLLAARSSGARRVRFFENGVISLNLPIARQVIGTMATRTTHPLGLQRLQTLLSLVAAEDITVDNPFTWLTKTEVVARLNTHGGAGMAGHSVSCSNVRDRTRLYTHCGACSQCLDRRFAMISAGLADFDPAEMYETELLEG